MCRASGIIGVVDDDLLAADVAYLRLGDEPAEGGLVGIGIEHGAVAIGLDGEEGTHRGEHHRAHPSAEPHCHLSLAGHFAAVGVEDIVDDEDEYGHQDGNAQAAPADDGAQRGSDEKEHHAGQ